MRLCVLLVILVGTLLSSLGALHAHALAPLDAVQHAQAEHGDAPGHSHEDESSAAYEGPSHTHLGADHSHDKAHCLPVMPRLCLNSVTPWKPRPLCWRDRLMSHRLERPPKAA